MSTPTCTDCEKQLDPEQAENPRRHDDGSVLCDECWSSEYEYLCPLCQNLVEIEDNQKHIFVTPDLAQDQRMQPGIYRIIKLPWFLASFCSMRIYQEALHRVCDLPPDLQRYTSGDYLCETCVSEAIAAGQPRLVGSEA